MKTGDKVKIVRLTEDGKEMFSWQFDETQNMELVRAVLNQKTGELILAIKVSKLEADKAVKINPMILYTEKGIWKLWHDGWNYIINREGDRV